MRYRSTSIKLLWGKFGLAPKPNRSCVTVFDVGVRNCSRNRAPRTRKTAIAAFLRLGLSDGTPCGSPARANHFRFSGDCLIVTWPRLPLRCNVWRAHSLGPPARAFFIDGILLFGHTFWHRLADLSGEIALTDLTLPPIRYPNTARLAEKPMQFDQLKRREFISLLGRAAAWSLAAYAQQTKVHRVGVLLVGNEDAGSFRTELREELRKSGYIEGQNLFFEFRSAAQKLDLLPRLAGELVALKVDVIVAVYTPCALAAKQATREIPIVVMSGDPVGTGLVTSLSRPGGNITGVSLMAAELNAKSVELIHDMFPNVRRVAALGNAGDPFSKPFLEQVRLAGRTTGIEIAPATLVLGPNEIEETFATMKKEGA